MSKWFNDHWERRQRPPVPCADLQGLRTKTVVEHQGRTVVGGHILEPSGNQAFDDVVAGTLAEIHGQVVPEPPPIFPELLGPKLNPVFSGSALRCEDEQMK